MKRILYLFSLCSIVFVSCDKEEKAPEPSACFMVDKVDSYDSTHNFVFTNCSDNYQTPAWDFGDGHSSSEHNPSHRFNHAGQFTVTLTVTNSSGTSSINTRTITIGRYTLTKIVYNRLNTTVSYPKHAYLSYSTPALVQVFNDDATVNTASQVPFSVNLPENQMLYDLNNTFLYRFSENDFSGNSYNSNYFTVSNLEIVNNRLDKTFVYSGDTAKVSLYFKIVPR